MSHLARVPTALTALALAVACAKDADPERALPSAQPPSQPSVAPKAPTADDPPGARAAPPAGCEVVSEKIWTAVPSFAAGVTPTVLEDGRVAIGAVLGGRPQVVVFDAEGRGEVVRVGLGEPLRKALGKGDKRVISRVTPGLASGGAVVAYADYHEERGDERRVACGLTDADEAPLSFDGKPLLAGSGDDEADSDPKTKPVQGAAEADGPDPTGAKPTEAKPTEAKPTEAKPTEAKPTGSSDPAPAPAAEEAASASPAASVAAPPRSVVHTRTPPRLRTGTREEQLAAARELARARLRRNRERAATVSPEEKPAPKVAAEPSAKVAPPEPAAEAETPKPAGGAGSTGEEPLRELRSCRSFVDQGGAHSWSVGSELEGDRQKDGSVEYAMVFFAEREHGRGRSTLLRRPLGTSPSSVATFDAAAAWEVAPGEFTVAARYRGTLHAFRLDADKRLVGGVRVYPGGYPSMARFGADREPFLLSARKRGGSYGLFRLALGTEALPKTLDELVLPGGGDSKDSPSFAVLGSHRFVGYVAESGGRGAFKLLVVDPALSPLAPAMEIADDDEAVVDGQIFPLPSGKLLAVYLRAPKGKPALVSKILSCG